ncbi:two pore calcium channel protein 1-like [Galendromus occidentalis]|uniref:Two pore calcium channel protein 1-like n=1 Tax=Galendromus occidentalis TaxID=34638 RepID=A0AAJ6VW67_9ACAR|nr:two pore calcium channel protein 1-like [Galendromus occidentalis]
MMIPEDAQNEVLEQRDSAVDLEAFVEQDTREVRSNGTVRQSSHAASANDLLERLHIDNATATDGSRCDTGMPTYVDEASMIMAVALIKDAHHGIQSEFKMNLDSVRSYSIYNQFVLRILTYFFICIHHALIFFESPIDNGLTLPYYVTMMLELCCIAYYVFRLVHYSTFVDKQRFFSDTKIRMNLALIGLIIIDLIQYTIAIKLNGFSRRYTRVLRPLFIINLTENKQIRRAVRNIRRTLPKVVDVLILFLLTMSIFALVSLRLFSAKGIKSPDGTPYFTEGFFENFYQLYVLVTSANNPDVMMPAYAQSHWYAIFFFVYLLVCMYIFLNIILAVVYNNYKEHLRNEVCSMVIERRKNLRKAFDLLTATQNSSNRYITFEIFQNVLNRIGIRKGKTVLDIMWSVLDTTDSHRVEREDFAAITELLSLRFTQSFRRKSFFEMRFPDSYNSSLSLAFRRVVQSKWFRYTFDCLIVVNAFLLTIGDGSQLEILFLLAFVSEILAKMYTFGFHNFFNKKWNVFDFVIIGAALLGSIVESVMSGSGDDYKSFVDIILVVRCLRLAKIMSSIERFRVILTTIGRLLPSMATFAGILFGVYYMFAIIGLELFAGKIKEEEPDCGDHRLNGSTFVTSRYCANNFNDAASAFILLFELMVVNQWHVLAEGFVLVTSKYARAYFVIFHMTCVILVMNIFTAFVIEAFILEIGTTRSTVESRVVEKIEEYERRRCEESGCNRARAAPDSRDSDDSDHEDIDFTGTTCRNHDVKLKYKKSTRFEDLLMRMFNDEVDVIKLNESLKS